MYPVTTEFKQKITDPKNRKVFGRVEINYTDLFEDENVNVTANEVANISYPKQIADSVRNPIGKILSLDGSSSFDGTYVLAPIQGQQELQQMGWWGSTLSGVGGVLSVLPAITMEFTARPILKFNITADRARVEYPVDFNIKLYDATETLLHTEVIVGNTKVDFEKILTSPITSVVKLVLEVSKWSHEYRQVKITELYTAIREVYEGEDIITVDLIEEKEIGITGLPVGNISTNQLTVKLDNSSRKFDAGNPQSPLYNLIKPNRRMSAFLGVELDSDVIEYVPLGTFWTGDWDVPEKMAYATTSGGDRLKFFEKTTFIVGTVLQNVTLLDLATMVFVDFGLQPNEYYIDPLLADITIPIIYFPEGISHRELLRKIAEVSLGHIYCDRLGVIRVEGSEPPSESYIVSVNEENTISCKDQITNTTPTSEVDYIMLDGYNGFDGVQGLAPTDCSMEIGWVGSQLSDASGNFTSPYPTVTLDFLEKAITNVGIVGDNLKAEYPVDFVINAYDNDGVILSTKTIVGNTDLVKVVSISENPTSVVKIDLKISKWSKANTTSKIIEFRLVNSIDDLSGGEFTVYITDNEYFRKNNPLQYNQIANYLDIEYTPISVLGEGGDTKKVIIRNEESIVENGLKTFNVSGNELIQTFDLSINILNRLMEIYSNSKRNLELDWRGNPAFLLNELVKITDDTNGSSYRITSQQLTYNGVLRATMKGRKL